MKNRYSPISKNLTPRMKVRQGTASYPGEVSFSDGIENLITYPTEFDKWTTSDDAVVIPNTHPAPSNANFASFYTADTVYAAAASYGSIKDDVTVTSNINKVYYFSIYIRKETVTSKPLFWLSLLGGASERAGVKIDTLTGSVYTVASVTEGDTAYTEETANVVVRDHDESWWEMTAELPDINGTATLVSLQVEPRDDLGQTTSEASVVVWGATIREGVDPTNLLTAPSDLSDSTWAKTNSTIYSDTVPLPISESSFPEVYTADTVSGTAGSAGTIDSANILVTSVSGQEWPITFYTRKSTTANKSNARLSFTGRNVGGSGIESAAIGVYTDDGTFLVDSGFTQGSVYTTSDATVISHDENWWLCTLTLTDDSGTLDTIQLKVESRDANNTSNTDRTSVFYNPSIISSGINLVTNPNEIDEWYMAGASIVITNTHAAPGGTLTADTLTTSAGVLPSLSDDTQTVTVAIADELIYYLKVKKTETDGYVRPFVYLKDGGGTTLEEYNTFVNTLSGTATAPASIISTSGTYTSSDVTITSENSNWWNVRLRIVDSGAGTGAKGRFLSYFYDTDQDTVLERSYVLGEVTCLKNDTGANLFDYATEYDDAAWSKGPGLTVSANTHIAPDAPKVAQSLNSTDGDENYVRSTTVASLTSTVDEEWAASVFVAKSTDSTHRVRVRNRLEGNSGLLEYTEANINTYTGAVLAYSTLNTSGGPGYSTSDVTVESVDDDWWKVTAKATDYSGEITIAGIYIFVQNDTPNDGVVTLPLWGASQYKEDGVNIIDEPHDFDHSDWTKYNNTTVSANTFQQPSQQFGDTVFAASGTTGSTFTTITGVTSTIDKEWPFSFYMKKGFDASADTIIHKVQLRNSSNAVGEEVLMYIDSYDGAITLFATPTSQGAGYTENATVVESVDDDWWKVTTTLKDYSGTTARGDSYYYPRDYAHLTSVDRQVYVWDSSMNAGEQQANLIDQPNDFDHSDWTKSNGAVVTSNSHSQPGGSLEADTITASATAAAAAHLNTIPVTSTSNDVWNLKFYIRKDTTATRIQPLIQGRNSGDEILENFNSIINKNTGAIINVNSASTSGGPGYTTSDVTVTDIDSKWWLVTLRMEDYSGDIETLRLQYYQADVNGTNTLERESTIWNSGFYKNDTDYNEVYAPKDLTGSGWSSHTGVTVTTNTHIAPEAPKTADTIYGTSGISSAIAQGIAGLTTTSGQEFFYELYMRKIATPFDYDLRADINLRDATTIVEQVAATIKLKNGAKTVYSAVTNGPAYTDSDVTVEEVDNDWWKLRVRLVDYAAAALSAQFIIYAKTINGLQPVGESEPIAIWNAGMFKGDSTTNLVTNPNNFDHADWVKGGAFININTHSAPRTQTADTLTGDSDYNFLLDTVTGLTAVAGKNWYHSVYIKKLDSLSVDLPRMSHRIRNAVGTEIEQVDFYIDPLTGVISDFSTTHTNGPTDYVQDDTALVTSHDDEWWKLTIILTDFDGLASQYRVYLYNKLADTDFIDSEIVLWGANLNDGASTAAIKFKAIRHTLGTAISDYRVVIYWDNPNNQWIIRLFDDSGTLLSTVTETTQSDIPATVAADPTMAAIITAEYRSDLDEGTDAAGSLGTGYADGSPFTGYRR